MKKLNISPKAKKIINIVIDVIVVVILFFAVFLAVNTIRSKVKGYNNYTEILGKAYISVASNSMAKDYETGEVREDNFSEGDMICIRLLSKGDMAKLKKGDIITFNTKGIVQDANGNEKWVLNTHRIESISAYNGGYKFTTKGDNNPSADAIVYDDNVIGIYEGKIENVGVIMLFMGSSWGFVLFVLLPSLLIVAYAAFNLVMVIKKEKKVQETAAQEEMIAAEKAKQEDIDAAVAAERERIRQELLAEMQGAPATPADAKPAESVTVSEETVAEPATQPAEPVAQAEPATIAESETIAEPATIAEPEPTAEAQSEQVDESVKTDNDID